jgi:hypothetical protein
MRPDDPRDGCLVPYVLIAKRYVQLTDHVTSARWALDTLDKTRGFSSICTHVNKFAF